MQGLRVGKITEFVAVKVRAPAVVSRLVQGAVFQRGLKAVSRLAQVVAFLQDPVAVSRQDLEVVSRLVQGVASRRGLEAVSRLDLEVVFRRAPAEVYRQDLAGAFRRAHVNNARKRGCVARLERGGRQQADAEFQSNLEHRQSASSL
jgi:hypothetical protein